MRVVAVAGAKGGVGKSAAAVNLAMIAARAGFRTLLWDLDPNGAATHCYRAHARVKGGASPKLERGCERFGVSSGTRWRRRRTSFAIEGIERASFEIGRKFKHAGA